MPTGQETCGNSRCVCLPCVFSETKCPARGLAGEFSAFSLLFFLRIHMCTFRLMQRADGSYLTYVVILLYKGKQTSQVLEGR